MKNSLENIRLMMKLKELGITEVNLTALGNSISSGFAMFDIIKPLLERNDSLDIVSKKFNIKLNKYNMARAQKNNDNDIYNWILNNISLQDMYNMNISDYFGSSKMECIHFPANVSDYTLDKDNKNIQEILKENHPSLANIVIYHGCTGSFLDNVTRSGKHYLTDGIKKDLISMEATLQYIRNQNRTLGTNTQVYLGSAPNALGLHITDIINIPVKKISKKYPNTSFIKPVKESALRKYDGKIVYDIHYTKEEYDKLNTNIIESIDDNYIYKYALINIDRELVKLSSKVEFTDQEMKKDSNFMINEIEKILEPWFSYIINHKGNMYKFSKLVMNYFVENYCYDFYYIDKEIVTNKIKEYSK